MTVGLLVIDCIISDSHSLKDKRRVLTSAFERLRRKFNVAVCECEFQDKWQRAQLAVVVVNTRWRMAQSCMSKVVEHLERDRRITILDTDTQQLC